MRDDEAISLNSSPPEIASSRLWRDSQLQIAIALFKRRCNRMVHLNSLAKILMDTEKFFVNLEVSVCFIVILRVIRDRLFFQTQCPSLKLR